MSDEHETPPYSNDADLPLDDPETLSEEDIVSEDGPEAELDALKAENAELKDRFLRLAAELDNTRRRADREKADASRYAIANFARDLIGVADNFERAFRVAESGGEGSTAALIDGLKMTEKELLSTLERHGIKRVAAEREKFDPNVHQAVAQIPHAEIPHGHVVDVAQQGFTIGDRVLRAAMVTVSSGPGAGAEKSPPSEPGEKLDTKF